MHYAVAGNRIDITLDGDRTTSVWWATKNEWLRLAGGGRGPVRGFYGGSDGEPLDDDSRAYMVVARRPA